MTARPEFTDRDRMYLIRRNDSLWAQRALALIDWQDERIAELEGEKPVTFEHVRGLLHFLSLADLGRLYHAIMGETHLRMGSASTTFSMGDSASPAGEGEG